MGKFSSSGKRFRLPPGFTAVRIPLEPRPSGYDLIRLPTRLTPPALDRSISDRVSIFGLLEIDKTAVVDVVMSDSVELI